GRSSDAQVQRAGGAQGCDQHSTEADPVTLIRSGRDAAPGVRRRGGPRLTRRQRSMIVRCPPALLAGAVDRRGTLSPFEEGCMRILLTGSNASETIRTGVYSACMTRQARALRALPLTG